MGITEEFAALVDKHLPAEIGDRLKDRLAQVSDLEERLRDAEESNEAFRQRQRDYADMNDREANLGRREKAIFEKEAECDRRMNALHVQEQINAARMDCEEMRRKDAMSFVDKLLGNRLIREKVQGEIALSTGDRESFGSDGSVAAVSCGDTKQPTEGTREIEEA